MKNEYSGKFANNPYYGTAIIWADKPQVAGDMLGNPVFIRAEDLKDAFNQKKSIDIVLGHYENANKQQYRKREVIGHTISDCVFSKQKDPLIDTKGEPIKVEGICVNYTLNKDIDKDLATKIYNLELKPSIRVNFEYETNDKGDKVIKRVNNLPCPIATNFEVKDIAYVSNPASSVYDSELNGGLQMSQGDNENVLMLAFDKNVLMIDDEQIVDNKKNLFSNEKNIMTNTLGLQMSDELGKETNNNEGKGSNDEENEKGKENDSNNNNEGKGSNDEENEKGKENDSNNNNEGNSNNPTTDDNDSSKTPEQTNNQNGEKTPENEKGAEILGKPTEGGDDNNTPNIDQQQNNQINNNAKDIADIKNMMLEFKGAVELLSQKNQIEHTAIVDNLKLILPFLAQSGISDFEKIKEQILSLSKVSNNEIIDAIAGIVPNNQLDNSIVNILDNF